MQEWHAPDPHLTIVPGKWRGEIGWPPRNVANTTLYLYEAHVLSTDPAKPAFQPLRYVPSVGVEAAFWRGDLLTDQRPLATFSLVYDSAALKSERTIPVRHQSLLQARSSAPRSGWF